MEDNHVYTKAKVEELLNNCKNKTLIEIDNKHIFETYETTELQKGIAGKIIEECVFGYDSNSKQEPDLVIDGTLTELKTTGLIKDKDGNYKAKEPVSITAVSVYTISNEEFLTSHFWEKLEHLLFVFYEYIKIDGKKMTPYDYKDFPFKGYYFNEISEEDKQCFKSDWENVHSLVSEITSNYPNVDEKEWKEKVKNEYIRRRKEIREKGLNFIDLAPKFPPRFRLKPSYASFIISKYFGYQYSIVDNVNRLDELDKKCKELERKYAGKTLTEIARMLGEDIEGDGPKNISEMIVTKMFTGKSCKLNSIELFSKFGIIAKTCVYTSSGSLSEDTKLFSVDFDEITRKKYTYYDENNNAIEKEYEFEDSDLYNYFNNNQFLIIKLIEPEPEFEYINGKKKRKKHPLKNNTFIGFKRFSFDDDIINGDVKRLWEDTRDKILNNKLIDVPTIKGGKQLILSNGEASTSPNFFASTENSVFIKGGALKSTSEYKTQIVNGIKMLPQFYWIHKGKLKKIIE